MDNRRTGSGDWLAPAAKLVSTRGQPKEKKRTRGGQEEDNGTTRRRQEEEKIKKKRKNKKVTAKEQRPEAAFAGAARDCGQLLFS